MSTSMPAQPETAAEHPQGLSSSIDHLIKLGKTFYDKNWTLGTSGNFSSVLSRNPYRLLITASGKDKSQLRTSDFVIVDRHGENLETCDEKPSAETQLHLALTTRAGINCVLHTHSVWSTLLSQKNYEKGYFSIAGYEMLKGLRGVTTHDATAWVKIYQNSQDIEALAQRISLDMDSGVRGLQHGFLLQGHGLYTWGKDIAEAKRHIEILEFLLELAGRS